MNSLSLLLKRTTTSTRSIISSSSSRFITTSSSSTPPSPTPTTTASTSATIDSIASLIQNSSPSLSSRAPSIETPERKNLKKWLPLSSPTFASSQQQPQSTAAVLDTIWRTSQTRNTYGLPVTTTSSRTVDVKSANVAVAFRKLNRILTENNIRREVKRADRFEGRSDKRVRLSSERHRKRFKVAVGKAVGLAMRMKD